MALFAVLWANVVLGQLAEPVFEKKIADLAAAGGPGVAMSVFRDGKPVYQRAFGVADEATKDPYRVDQSFEIGSLSKQFTATAILMLVKEGKLSIKDPIGKYLDEIPETWKVATVEQVLHHMSGIPDYEEIAGYDFYNTEHKPEEIIAEAAKKPLDFQPGDKFNYSNTGYYVLGMIVTKVSGTPVAEFLEQRVFKPVGMTHTYAIHRPAGLHFATGYHSRTGTRTAQPPIAWSSSYGAGAIVSTLEDMNTWDQALYTRKLLPDNLRNQLWSTAKTNSGDTVNYGYGWFSGDFRGIPYKDHSGQTNGFTCYYFRFPAQHMMVLVHTNTYDGQVGSIANILSAHFVPSANYFTMKPSSQPAEVTAKHLALLRTCIYGEGSMDEFSPGLKEFATADAFKKRRDELRPSFDTLKSFKFVSHRSLAFGKGQKTDYYVYRHDSAEKTHFWTLRFRDGKFIGLNGEDE